MGVCQQKDLDDPNTVLVPGPCGSVCTVESTEVLDARIGIVTTDAAVNAAVKLKASQQMWQGQVVPSQIHVDSPNACQHCSGAYDLVEGGIWKAEVVWHNAEKERWLYLGTSGRWYIDGELSKNELFNCSEGYIRASLLQEGLLPPDISAWERGEAGKWKQDADICVSATGWTAACEAAGRIGSVESASTIAPSTVPSTPLSVTFSPAVLTKDPDPPSPESPAVKDSPPTHSPGFGGTWQNIAAGRSTVPSGPGQGTEKLSRNCLLNLDWGWRCFYQRPEVASRQIADVDGKEGTTEDLELPSEGNLPSTVAVEVYRNCLDVALRYSIASTQLPHGAGTRAQAMLLGDPSALLALSKRGATDGQLPRAGGTSSAVGRQGLRRQLSRHETRWAPHREERMLIIDGKDGSICVSEFFGHEHCTDADSLTAYVASKAEVVIFAFSSNNRGEVDILFGGGVERGLVAVGTHKLAMRPTRELADSPAGSGGSAENSGEEGTKKKVRRGLSSRLRGRAGSLAMRPEAAAFRIGMLFSYWISEQEGNQVSLASLDAVGEQSMSLKERLDRLCDMLFARGTSRFIKEDHSRLPSAFHTLHPGCVNNAFIIAFVAISVRLNWSAFATIQSQELVQREQFFPSYDDPLLPEDDKLKEMVGDLCDMCDIEINKESSPAFFDKLWEYAYTIYIGKDVHSVDSTQPAQV